ncbi:MAG: diaminopimelate decarboxylase [Acidobacteria bacterium]|nr:diaminopimelate decarboxylase [Acidobacteriota bacterium]
MRRRTARPVPFFEFRGGALHCEGVSLVALANDAGTPLYVYSQSALEDRFRAFDGAFSDFPHLTCYAAKACSSLAILALLHRMGAGIDVVSGGELRRALMAGVDPRKIVFSGVGKSVDEMDLALRHGILQFNAESEAELRLLGERAKMSGMVAPVGLRVNPAVDPQTHPYIATGLEQSKFGVPISAAVPLLRRYSRHRHIRIQGIGCHIGSQITEIGPFVVAARKLKEATAALRATGIEIRQLDLGGGLGIRYDDETPPSPTAYAAAIKSELRDLGCSLILEPGRTLVGDAGIFLTRVLFAKAGQGRNFLIVDGAMNDLVRPSLYGAYHRVLPVVRSRRAAWLVDVVGPVCESSDFLARDRILPRMRAGELLAILSAGAYGFVLSSNYNSRPRAAEILVKGHRFRVIRKRETLPDLVRGESARPFR